MYIHKKNSHINSFNDAIKQIPIDFNWEDYIEMNQDLLDLIDSELKAITHWINYGKNEKRKYKYELPENFNWVIYIKLNPDIPQYYNKREAIHHWLNYGKNENRPYKIEDNIKEKFNWLFYTKINNLNLNSFEDAWEHYNKIGFLNNYVVDYLDDAFDSNVYENLMKLSKTNVLIICDAKNLIKINVPNDFFLIKLLIHDESTILIQINTNKIIFKKYFNIIFDFNNIIKYLHAFKINFIHLFIWNNISYLLCKLIYCLGIKYYISLCSY